MPDEIDFQAARKAALNCASAVGTLMWAATGNHKMRPSTEAAVRELLARCEPPPEPIGPPCCPAYRPPTISVRKAPDPDADTVLERSLLESGIKGLCESLDAARRVIVPFTPYLERVSAGPCRAGGIVHSTAHRLAYDLAYRVWLAIRNAVPELQLRELETGCSDGGFALDGDIVQAHLGTIRASLRTRVPVAVDELKASIALESARAEERFADFKADSTAPGPTATPASEDEVDPPIAPPARFPEAPASKRRPKGSVPLLLVAAIESAAAKGQWGLTDTKIIALADISRDSFYKYMRDSDDVKRKMEEYRRQTLGRGPVRPSNL